MRIIESEVVEREYGFRGTQAIVEHDILGKIVIEDGFGGMDSPAGGAVRWRHGVARKCAAEDTLASLREVHLDERAGPWRRLDELSVLPWNGADIERIAANLGL